MTIPNKEFELLYKLGCYPRQLFTRDNLIEQIWGSIMKTLGRLRHFNKQTRKIKFGYVGVC
jgi:DNA-binding response OmpR family regulator